MFLPTSRKNREFVLATFAAVVEYHDKNQLLAGFVLAYSLKGGDHDGGGDIAAGYWGTKLRDHNFDHKHKAKELNWKWFLSSARLHLLKGP